MGCMTLQLSMAQLNLEKDNIAFILNPLTTIVSNLLKHKQLVLARSKSDQET